MKHPIDAVRWVPVECLQANDYNPNRVASPELKLLELSLLEDGWTQPIVCYNTGQHLEIVDGFHRWTVASRNRKVRKDGNLVPVVVIEKAEAERMASTVRHNRARGRHLIAPMVEIVQRMQAAGLEKEAVGKALGMSDEELHRLWQRRTVAESCADAIYSDAEPDGL